MLPGIPAFGLHEVSDLYKQRPVIEALLKERYQVSPEVFNMYIAKSVAHAMQPPKKTNSDYQYTVVRSSPLDEPIYNSGDLSVCVESNDRRLWKNNTLTLDQVVLPQAVVERLGYKNARTAADWIRNLPIAERIIWNEKEPLSLTAKAYTTLVPLTDKIKTASVSFEVQGKEDDTWIYLSYSLNGDNIGEAVATYHYDGYHEIVTGRYNEQKSCPNSDRTEYRKNLSRVEPLQATYDQQQINQATYVTIAVKLNEDPPNHSSSSSNNHLNTRWPVTFPTGTRPFPFAHDGKFTFDRYDGYISVTTAVGVNFTSRPNSELDNYYNALCKRFNDGMDVALTTLWGPTSEKIKAIMVEKLGLTALDDPKITLLADAETTRFDYTKSVVDTPPSDGRVRFRLGALSSTPALPTQVLKQPGRWYENYPQIIRFASDKDANLPANERICAIFNYNPQKQSYERHTHSQQPTKVSFDELK